MKTKTYKYILFTLLALLIGYFIYLALTYEEKPFSKIEINTTNMVSNKTEMSHVDTVLFVGLKELGLNHITILVKPMDDYTKSKFKKMGIDISAYVSGGGNQYMLYLVDMNRRVSIDVLSHELIHLSQYHTDRLDIAPDVIHWDGNIYAPNDFEYNDRPWEVEARYRGGKLEHKMKKILYN